MAKVVINPKNLPERTVPIPRSKEPVSSLPYKDIGHPEEVKFALLLPLDRKTLGNVGHRNSHG